MRRPTASRASKGNITLTVMSAMDCEYIFGKRHGGGIGLSIQSTSVFGSDEVSEKKEGRCNQVKGFPLDLRIVLAKARLASFCITGLSGVRGLSAEVHACECGWADICTISQME